MSEFSTEATEAKNAIMDEIISDHWMDLVYMSQDDNVDYDTRMDILAIVEGGVLSDWDRRTALKAIFS